MNITISLKECFHLKERSNYNHNYYKLPYEVSGYNCILEICEEEYDSYLYVLGDIKNVPFNQYDINTVFVYSPYGSDICLENISFDIDDYNKEYF